MESMSDGRVLAAPGAGPATRCQKEEQTFLDRKYITVGGSCVLNVLSLGE